MILASARARQRCGQLGKRANGQSLVLLTLAQDEVPVPVGLRLFLPEAWTGDAVRAARAGVPQQAMAPRSKGKIALAGLGRLLAAGVRFATVLAALPWRRVTWRHETKRLLGARFAAVRVRVGDSPVWGNNRHLPDEEAWLVGERRTSGERKCYLSNLGAKTSLRALAAAIKARSRTGLHRHALMACIASACNTCASPGTAGQGGGTMPTRPSRVRPRNPACLPCAVPAQHGCSNIPQSRSDVRNAGKGSCRHLN